MRSNLRLFDERVRGAYDLIARVPPDFRNGAFLDVGCGIGNGVIAALMHGASFAVGIDADLGEFADVPRDRILSGQPIDFVPEEMPAIFRHFKVDPARALRGCAAPSRQLSRPSRQCPAGYAYRLPIRRGALH